MFEFGTPDNMPEQAPTKYELVIISDGKSFGRDITVTILARADEVIE